MYSSTLGRVIGHAAAGGRPNGRCRYRRREFHPNFFRHTSIDNRARHHRHRYRRRNVRHCRRIRRTLQWRIRQIGSNGCSRRSNGPQGDSFTFLTTIHPERLFGAHHRRSRRQDRRRRTRRFKGGYYIFHVQTSNVAYHRRLHRFIRDEAGMSARDFQAGPLERRQVCHQMRRGHSNPRSGGNYGDRNCFANFHFRCQLDHRCHNDAASATANASRPTNILVRAGRFLPRRTDRRRNAKRHRRIGSSPASASVNGLQRHRARTVGGSARAWWVLLNGRRAAIATFPSIQVSNITWGRPRRSYRNRNAGPNAHGHKGKAAPRNSPNSGYARNWPQGGVPRYAVLFLWNSVHRGPLLWPNVELQLANLGVGLVVCLWLVFVDNGQLYASPSND